MEEETICWDCLKSCGGCSWSKSFVPVEGWKTKKTYFTNEKYSSYVVLECPKYKAKDTYFLRKDVDIDMYLLFKKYKEFLSEAEQKFLMIYFKNTATKASESIGVSLRTGMRKISYLRKELKFLDSIFGGEKSGRFEKTSL